MKKKILKCVPLNIGKTFFFFFSKILIKTTIKCRSSEIDLLFIKKCFKLSVCRWQLLSENDYSQMIDKQNLLSQIKYNTSTQENV